MCRQQVDLDRRLMRMAVSDRDMCLRVHQLQRKSVRNNSIAPLELSTQLNSTTNQIEPKRSERKSIWQIASLCCGSFSLTNRIVSLDTLLCHLPPVCQPASESPSAALWLLLTMAKAKKKRKKSAQKTETQMKTHINCAFVSINEQGPTHNSKTRKTLAQKMTFHTQTHTHLTHLAIIWFILCHITCAFAIFTFC